MGWPRRGPQRRRGSARRRTVLDASNWVLADHIEAGFADGAAGHAVALPGGAAATAGQIDVVLVGSDATVSTPSGFTVGSTFVSNQGGYGFYRICTGGESATVTITTSVNANTSAHFSRWSGGQGFDVAANGHIDNSGGTTSPSVSTGALASANDLVVTASVMTDAVSGNATAPVWSAGYIPLGATSSGTSTSASVGFSAYKIGAGTGSESPSVTWTNSMRNRYIFALTFTPAVAGGTTASPAVIATVAALPRPAVNVNAGPTAVAAVATLPRPDTNVAAGPVAIATAATLPRPAVNVAVGAAVITATVALPTPTVLAGGNTTVNPAVITATATLPRPAVNVSAGPAAIPVVVTVPLPGENVSAGPVAITAVVGVPRPAVNTSAVPAAVILAVTLPAAAVNVTAGPASIPVTVALPTPGAGGTTTAAPATIQTTVTLPRPAGNVSAGPATFTVQVAIPTPFIPGQTGKAISTATVVAAVSAVAAVVANRTSAPGVT